MTDQSAQEPTMEEILASIRRIISEDDAPAETPPAQAEPESAPEPEPPVFEEPAPVEAAAEPEPEPEAEAEEEVLDLTERYEAPPAAETIGDLDVSTPDPFPSVEPSPEPVQQTASAPMTSSYDPLVGESAAASAASAFAGLAASLRQPDPDLPQGAGTSLEALVGSLLRPMLKDWLDANLPAIVEAQVKKEVERIARNAG